MGKFLLCEVDSFFDEQLDQSMCKVRKVLQIFVFSGRELLSIDQDVDSMHLTKAEVEAVIGSPLIKRGTHMLLKGNLWVWQEDILDVLDRFENAVREEAFVGSADPLDRDAISQEYLDAKAELYEVLRLTSLNQGK